MVGGLPKESTEERYWDSIDGDELPREPLSGSPGNPWYISPGGPKENATPAGTGERERCHLQRQGSGTHKKITKGGEVL